MTIPECMQVLELGAVTCDMTQAATLQQRVRLNEIADTLCAVSEALDTEGDDLALTKRQVIDLVQYFSEMAPV